MLNVDEAAKTTRAALAVLARTDAAQFEVMEALKCLDQSPAEFRSLKLGLAANITLDLLAVYLRRHAYLAGVRLQVAKGTYDDLLGDVQAHAGVDLLLILPFFDNLQPSWESQLGALDEGAWAPAQADYLNRLALALGVAEGIGQVLLCSAHLLNPQVAANSPQQQALDAFNQGLAALAAAQPQVKLINMDGLLAQIGARHAFDARFYFRAKAPYTAGFVDALAQQVGLATRGFVSHFYKVLVLDCDNTLWGGIVGEDGVSGIKLDRHGFPGNVFWTVQQQFKALERQGVLLCLNSKNNPADVDEVLLHHPEMVLRDAQILVKQVNWTDKPSNLRALAEQLNLGLDSFVFVDDSAFETSAVREQLPQVRVFQVPKALQDYPALVREQIAPLFGVSSAQGLTLGQNKTQQYRALAQASELQAGFANQQDYLRSLQLTVTLQRDALDQVARITELMNKSNQFNLSTRRLAAGDVQALMVRADARVYSFAVSDRLAEHGLTGVLITEDDGGGEGDTVVVHSFLMSCRVIGRGIEFAVWRAVCAEALARGKRRLRAAYHPTAKNAQVADFYDRLGLPRLAQASDGSRSYEADLAAVQLADSEWVELRNA